jgi:protein SCO1/2
MARVLCTALAASTLSAGSAAPVAAEGTAVPESAMAASRAALGRKLGDYTLTSSDGRPVRLAELRGRPLVVNMIYTSCFDFCPTLTTALAPKIGIARDALGRGRFTVLTIGFDARNDTPARMGEYARMLGLGGAEWLFLSGDERTIAALAADLGFTYRRTVAGFDHAALITIVDAKGRVHRQLYGTDYPVPALVEPLKALVLGTQEAAGVTQLLERVRLWCTVYDPRSGRYRLDYSLILSAVLGVACFAAFGIFLAREWRRSRRAPRGAAAP